MVIEEVALARGWAPEPVAQVAVTLAQEAKAVRVAMAARVVLVAWVVA